MESTQQPFRRVRIRGEHGVTYFLMNVAAEPGPELSPEERRMEWVMSRGGGFYGDSSGSERPTSHLSFPIGCRVECVLAPQLGVGIVTGYTENRLYMGEGDCLVQVEFERGKGNYMFSALRMVDSVDTPCVLLAHGTFVCISTVSDLSFAFIQKSP